MKQKDCRKAHGLTLDAFAERLDIHKQSAWRYEHGRVPRPPIMRRIRDAFPEITLEDYLGASSENGESDVVDAVVGKPGDGAGEGNSGDAANIAVTQG